MLNEYVGSVYTGHVWVAEGTGSLDGVEDGQVGQADGEGDPLAAIELADGDRSLDARPLAA